MRTSKTPYIFIISLAVILLGVVVVFAKVTKKTVSTVVTVPTSINIGTTEVQTAYIEGTSTVQGKNYIKADYIEWLSGKEGLAACKADGGCEENILFNDYYLRNQDKQLQNLPLSSQVKIFLIDLGVEITSVPISFVDFAEKMRLPESDLDYLRNQPFEIVLKEGEVISVHQIYIP